jgi:hypothetical protein
MKKLMIKKSQRNHLMLVGLLLLTIFIKFNHIIVFENPIVNLRLTFVIYFILILLFINSFLLEQIWAKIISAITFGFFCLFGFVILLFTLWDIDNTKDNHGKDFGFECIREINMNKIKIKAYRTNGGATTDFGIVVREERELFSGILFTNIIYNKYHMDTVMLKVENKTLVITDREFNIVKKKDYK